MTWTVGTLTEVIARARLNHRSAAYVAALERRLSKLRDGEEREAAPVVLAVESSPEAEAALDAFTEACTALLDVAHDVSDESGELIGGWLDVLASWWPLIGEDGSEVDEI